MAAHSLMRSFGRVWVLFDQRLLLDYCRLPRLLRLARNFNSSDSSSGDEEVTKKLDLAKPTRKRVRDSQGEPKETQTISTEDGIDPSLVLAARSVAGKFPGAESTIESDLLRQLQKHVQKTRKRREGTDGIDSLNTSDILSGMKVDRTKMQEDKPPVSSGATQRTGISSTPGGQMRGRRSTKENYKLFDGQRLKIFDIEKLQALETTPTKQSLWDIVQQEELDKMADRPPTNAFEEMIQWTKQGKLWHFPIDNEQGWVDEANVPFHEHVFLEKHIQDFPKTGPLRHFIELVTVGLSKNPYISVQQKVEHINWFRDYFKNKMHIIEDSVKHAKTVTANS